MITILIMALLAWLALLWFEWANVYKPDRAITETPAGQNVEFEDVTFVAEDGKLLNGWWVPCEDARGTIIYCHGNAGNLGGRVKVCTDLPRLGVNVFIFDYRGYGKSRGWSSEQGTYRDARAAYEFVRARHDDSDDPPVIVYGGSLGAAVATQLALDKKIRGLILENAFTSVPNMGERIYPWLPVRALGRIRYDTVSKIGRIIVPKLIAHSRDDELIPYDMGEELFKKSTHPKTFVTLAGPHNEAGWDVNPTFWTELGRFVKATLQ